MLSRSRNKMSLHTHNGTGVLGIRQINTADFSIASSKSITDQLNSIFLIPKVTIPDVAIDDVVFRHSGEPTLRSDNVLAERWTVTGIQYIGNQQTQVFVCVKV